MVSTLVTSALLFCGFTSLSSLLGLRLVHFHSFLRRVCFASLIEATHSPFDPPSVLFVAVFPFSSDRQIGSFT